MTKTQKKNPVLSKFEKHKGTILVILSIVVSVFLSKLFFDNTNKALREKVKEEEAKIAVYQEQRDSLETARKALETDFQNSQSKIDEDKKEIEKLNSQLSKSQKDLHDAKLSVAHYKSEYDIINKKIAEIKSNPIKRTGDDLLNSLKKNLNN